MHTKIFFKLACIMTGLSISANIFAEASLPHKNTPKIQLPLHFSDVGYGTKFLPLNSAYQRPMTIIPEIQEQLNHYVKTKGSPIASVVLVEVSSGKILSVVQGRDPQKWGAKTHTAFHTGFPAASLFKTVVTAAAFEYADLDMDAPVNLIGGCAHVRPTAHWMNDSNRASRYPMTLKKAYGHSCNSFFARIAINDVGLGSILAMSKKFGWEANQTDHFADFQIPASPMDAPKAATSSVYTVGRFAAGFGNVNLSPMHAAWQTLMIANDGIARPLQLFTNPESTVVDEEPHRQISSETAAKIREAMRSTVDRGTATSTFRGRYRKLREDMGGKTGTLTGTNPEGLTTWFAGMYPVDKPEVVVAAVVMLEDLWIFKAHTLAAEAVLTYINHKTKQVTTANHARANKINGPVVD